MICFYETTTFSHRNKRQDNQDLCGCMTFQSAPDTAGPEASVLFVADGVTNANGAEAAKRIGRAVRAPLAQLLSNTYDLADMERDARTREIFEQLRDAVADIDDALRPVNTCCATISIAVVLGSFVYTANLGDSPILLVRLDSDDRPTAVKELYACHNLAGKAVAEGRMPREEALTSELKDYLCVPVLGQDPPRHKIHTAVAGLGQNNLLLLGSDGALSVVPDDTLLQIIDEYIANGLEAVNQALFSAVQNTETADDNYTLLGQWIRTS